MSPMQGFHYNGVSGFFKMYNQIKNLEPISINNAVIVTHSPNIN